MAILVSAGDSVSKAPPGLYQGVCVDVIDMGVLEVSYKGETKKQHKIRVVWQLDETDDSGKRYVVQKRYTASLHEKSNLRKELESWRGRAFTKEELNSFDLEKLLLANAQINVQHSPDGQYANVVSIVPLGRGMVKIAPSMYERVKDRQPGSADQEEPMFRDEIFEEPPL